MRSCLMSKPVSFLTRVGISSKLYSLLAFRVYPLHNKSEACWIFRELATIFILNFLMLYKAPCVVCACACLCICMCVVCMFVEKDFHGQAHHVVSKHQLMSQELKKEI